MNEDLSKYNAFEDVVRFKRSLRSWKGSFAQ